MAFNDGASCETSDNEAIDSALTALHAHSFARGLHTLESRWLHVLIAVLVLGVGTWAGIQFGIPALAHRAAFALPVETDALLGSQALEALDRTVFEATTLPAARQRELQALFADMAAEVRSGHTFRLELRSSEALGANAFALPSGIVVLTDELVALSADDRELQAVLAHELGHVVNRHSLRAVLQNSATSLLMIGVLGDVSTASALVAALPTLLVQLKHSRAFELEADDYAYAWLDEHGVARHHFGALLLRLEQQAGEDRDAVANWLSSHPRTAERLRN
ncbi:MAG: M48 family metallopeptidase [Gammaproteobacteria bacterium]|nr:M48 family metallopeptidase [Gammaproteobacteria bacterium]